MNDFLKSVITPEVVLSTIGLFSAIVILRQKRVDYKMKKVEIKHSEEENSQENLPLPPMTKHSLHFRMDMLANEAINNFRYPESKGKELLCVDALVNKFKIFKRVFYELAIELDDLFKACPADNCINCTKVMDMHMKSVNRGMEEFRNYYRDGNYTPQEIECLDYFLEQFSKWHNPRVTIGLTSIESICNSKSAYRNCHIQSIVIYDIHKVMMNDTIVDGEKTLPSINGQLNGKTFKGVLIQEV